MLLTRELASEWPTLLAAGRPPDEEGELHDPKVTVHPVPLVRPIRPVTDAMALRAVRRLLLRLNPRILHTHMAKAGLVGRVAALGTGVRTIHTYHGHVLESYFSKPVERLLLEIERRLARTTDVLIAISPEVRDDLIDRGVGTASQFEVIPLGFDLERHLDVSQPSGLLRATLGITKSVPLVGTVGRLVPIKDIETLLRAMVLLPGVHLAILGDGDERANLEAMSRRLGLSDRCHWTGWWQDVPAAMSDLDVVALTSLNEGTPVSLIEALACGRPAVATDVGGVRFVIQHERTGLLVKPGDSHGVATALQRLLGSPDLAASLSRQGREFVRHKFDRVRLLADIRDLYSELVGRGGRSA